MPGSYFIDTANEIVFSRGWGVVTDDELLGYASALAADSRFRREFKQVAEFLDLTEIRLSSSGVMDLASRQLFHRDARRALVVGSEEAFGILRMFETYNDSNPAQFRIVRTLDEAFAWVGLPPGSSWPAQVPDRTFGPGANPTL